MSQTHTHAHIYPIFNIKKTSEKVLNRQLIVIIKRAPFREQQAGKFWESHNVNINYYGELMCFSIWNAQTAKEMKCKQAP